MATRKKKKSTSSVLNALTPKKKDVFLKSLAENGVVRYACDDAGTSQVTAYAHRKTDPVFAAAWAEATDGAIQRLEQEAFRRAADGVEEPIYYKGYECGKIRKYSDVLLMFLLKANRPAKYRDRFDINVSGNITHDHRLDMSALSEKDLMALETLTDKTRIIDSTAEKVA